MAAPVLQAYAGMRRLNRTKAGNGNVPLDQFLLVSGTPTSWTLTLTSGTAGHWTLPTDGSSPTPTTAGDNAELNGGPYVFSCVAQSADGPSNAVALTITVPGDVVGYTISKPADSDTSLRGGTDNGANIRANIGGRRVEYAKGCDTAFAATNSTWRTFNTHTGVVYVTSEDQSAPVVLSRLNVSGGVEGFYFDYINAKRTTPAHGPDNGELPVAGGSNAQNAAMVQVAHNQTYGRNADIVFDHFNIGPSAVEAPWPSMWCTGFNISGRLTTDHAPAVRITIKNTIIQRVKDGIVSSFTTDCLWENVIIDRFCSNGLFDGGPARNTRRNIIICRPTINRGDPKDHRDFMQTGAGTAFANYEGYIFDGIYCITADGNSGSQGPFFDDVASNSGSVSGFTQNNHTLRRIFYDGSAAQGIWMDGGSGWDVKFSTILRGETPDILSNNTTTGAFEAARRTVPNYDGHGAVDSTGVASHNFFQALGGDIDDAMIVGLTTDNYVMEAHYSRPVGWNNTLYNDEAERVAYYAPVFHDPGRDIDYANLTAAEILAQIRQAYAPVLNGPMKRPDGTYDGAFFPDGSDNDGSVYLATPATSVAQSIAVTTIAAGTPVLVTYTLDSNAVTAVEITPSVVGVTGSFSPPAVTIAPGANVGGTYFTADAAGSATLSVTNDSGLTNPTPLALTVTAPVDAPTSISQAANRTVIARGQSVVVTYQLDKIATDTVTITPAATLDGVFSTPAIVIPTGQGVGSASFLALEDGTIEFTATNDRSLTNPEEVFVIVVTATSTKGQMRKLGLG